jgi:hypothetical protein
MFHVLAMNTFGEMVHLCLLVDPLGAVALVVDDLTLLEPESNLLLGVLDAVGAVADISADVNGEVTYTGAD